MGLLSDLKSAGISGPDALKGIVRGMRPVTGYGDVGISDDDSGLSVGRAPKTPELRYVGIGRLIDSGPNGEDDFTDARYWFEWVAAEDGSPQDNLTLLRAQLGNGKKEVATNVGELPANATGNGTHMLSVGAFVAIYAVYGNGPDRLVFERGIERWVACNVEQTGGANGTQTTAPTYTYDVTPIYGHDLTTVPGLSPEWQRSNGKVIAATIGTAYWDDTGTLVLWQVDEVRDTTGC